MARAAQQEVWSGRGVAVEGCDRRGCVTEGVTTGLLLGKLDGVGLPLHRQSVEVVLHGVILAPSSKHARPQGDACNNNKQYTTTTTTTTTATTTSKKVDINY